MKTFETLTEELAAKINNKGEMITYQNLSYKMKIDEKSLRKIFSRMGISIIDIRRKFENQTDIYIKNKAK